MQFVKIFQEVMNVSAHKDLVAIRLAGVIDAQKMVFVVANLRIN